VAEQPLDVVVAGPLGAGKTTLVRRLARQARALSTSISVSIEEPGDAGIDLAALDDEGYRSAGSGGAGLWHITEIASREPLSDVWSRRASPLPSRRLVVVVDASRFDAHYARDCWRLAMASADCVLLNKCDTRFEAEISGLAETVRRLAPGAAVIPTVESTVTWDELLAAHRDHAPRSFAPPPELEYLSCDLERPLVRRTVERFISDPPAGVERAKGFVQIEGEPETWSVQITGRSGALRKAFLSVPQKPRIALAGAPGGNALRAAVERLLER